MEAFTTPFPHAFLEGEYMVGDLPKLVDELDILKIASCIRDKPNWEEKMRDPVIIAKWKDEASAIKPRMTQTDEKLDYVLAELEWVVGNYEPLTGIYSSTVDGTFHSDILIGESLRQELITNVQPLEDVPDSQKDWHPDTNNQVLDLVHPSLFPLVIGKSPVLKEARSRTETAGAAEPHSSTLASVTDPNNYKNLLYFVKDEELISPEDAEQLALSHVADFPLYSKSSQHQWLPSDVVVEKDLETGKYSAHFDSYINNLHPLHHPKLYHTLEKILAKFIPMFEKVLTTCRNPRKNRIILPDADWYEEIVLPNNEASDYDDSDSLEKIFKPFIIPPFEPPQNSGPFVNLDGRKLQVIVKLANIHLTPENPEYPGGVWHLEGMANEKIVASGIYYYSFDNITESRLNFRQAVQEPDYEQYDDTGVAVVYDLRDEEALNQNLGSILVKEGRCIGFPNTLQHRVDPFQLVDQTRPGHRKILVFFLIDPTISIISTSRVPPQQRSWFLGEIDKNPTPVPELVVHKIVGMLPYPMGLEKAKKVREELMQERKFFVKSNNESLFERPFSLCEH